MSSNPWVDNAEKSVGRYADVNGLHLYYEVRGTGKPLVLLHGGLGAIEMFGASLTEFAKNHQIIAVDLQGHGRTADIDRAVASARAAFADARWAGKAPAVRKKVLQRFAEKILAARDELALLETLDMGKPIQYSLGVDVASTARTIAWYAEAVDKVYDEIAPTPASALALITREPMGVIGVVVRVQDVRQPPTLRFELGRDRARIRRVHGRRRPGLGVVEQIAVVVREAREHVDDQLAHAAHYRTIAGPRASNARFLSKPESPCRPSRCPTDRNARSPRLSTGARLRAASVSSSSATPWRCESTASSRT